MSYVLQIWEKPQPRSVEDAARISEKLSEQSTGQNPKFIEFAKRLVDKYPCITTLEDPSEGAWTDGPLDGVTDEPIYGIGVQMDKLAAVIPYVVAVARTLGLVVFDDQAGQVYLPDERILTLGGRPPVSSQDEAAGNDALETASQVVNYVRQKLRPLMARYGFERGKRYVLFQKAFADVRHELQCDAVGRPNDFSLKVVYVIRVTLDDEFTGVLERDHLYANMPRLARKAGLVLSTGFRSPASVDYEIVVDGKFSLQLTVREVIELLSVAVLPITMQFVSIQSIDQGMNEGPLSEAPLDPISRIGMDIAIAYTAGNPNLDALIARGFADPPVQQWQRERFQQVVAVLNRRRGILDNGRSE